MIGVRLSAYKLVEIAALFVASIMSVGSMPGMIRRPATLPAFNVGNVTMMDLMALQFVTLSAVTYVDGSGSVLSSGASEVEYLTSLMGSVVA